MNIETIFSLLLLSSIINYCLLLIWFVSFSKAHDVIYRLHRTWFRITPEQFDMLNYGAMAIFKIEVILFNVVPLIALWIIG